MVEAHAGRRCDRGGIGRRGGCRARRDDGATTDGPIPEEAYGADGSVDLERVPDYVVTFDRDGEPVGYVARADLFAATGTATVVDRDGEVADHQRPGYGFVPVDADPAGAVSIEATAGPVWDH